MKLPQFLSPVFHERATPFSFEPPIRPNVSETYILATKVKNLKERAHEVANSPRPILEGLLKLRNLIVKRFGFKVDWQQGPFGPFDIYFYGNAPGAQHLTARYEDPHFSFYGELHLKEEKLILYSAVHFKTPEGMLYFWSIYLAHVQIFKNLLREIAQP